MDTGVLNYLWGLSIIHGYSLSGIQHAVTSPGSRSTPLTLACERHPEIKTWVQVDERSAAFFALGLALKSQRPVILVCTSGSAVANWFPAVVEANYAEVPLILLSADRPVELHNCGANQTINQQQLFGSHVRAFHAIPEPSPDLLDSTLLSELVAKSVSQSQQGISGPVHINIPFREPLLPQDEDLNEKIDELTKSVVSEHDPAVIPDQLDANQVDIDPFIEVIERGDGLIVVGRGTYSALFVENLNQLAGTLNVPVIVDHLSNLRFGQHEKTNYVVNYDLFLHQEDIQKQLGYDPDWVIRFGRFPVSKSLATYLSGCTDAISILVGDNARKQDPIRTADFFIQAAAETFCHQLLEQLRSRHTDKGLLASFNKQEDKAALAIDITLRQGTRLFEGHLITMLVEKMVDHSFIFTANSTAVRELDTFTVLNKYSDKSLSIYCNRGASGIDGNLSTYLGILAENKETPGVALLGDLAFFHDMNGLALCAELNSRGYSGTIIVINNNGGHIFNYLPQHRLREFERYWMTPLNMDISHAAALFSLGYQKADTISGLEGALDIGLNCQCINIIEVVIDQENSLIEHRCILEQLAT